MMVRQFLFFRAAKVCRGRSKSFSLMGSCRREGLAGVWEFCGADAVNYGTAALTRGTMSDSKPLSNDGKKHERKHVPGSVLPFLIRELVYLLEPAEWIIWSVLFLHANRDGYTYLLNSTVCTETGLSIATAQRAKRGLLAEKNKNKVQRGKWMVRCGQKDGFRSNLYQLRIGIPKTIEAFTDLVWETFYKEKWPESLGDDRHNYADNHLDWLIGWRVIRALRECDPPQSDPAKRWRPHQKISASHRDVTAEFLLEILRGAGEKLTEERGLWWLWGDGFDAERKLSNPP
jgi:hypothetical protein